MRNDNVLLAEMNSAPSKTPLIVIELSFDDANTDLLYLTSHPEADTPNGAQVISDVVSDVSGSSQKLDTQNFNSTIGNMRFSVIDKSGAFSSYLRTKLASDLAITKKRVRFYLGYENLDFADYALVQTQIVEREEVADNLYTIRCYDVQRQARKEIFERKETILTADAASDDATFTVQSTDGFETYYHGTSYSVSPSSTVGHLLIVDSGDREEIVTYTGKTATTFTGITRGQFGTEPLEFTAIEDGKNRNIKVYEYIYLEMPAVKMAYAILTGTLYNDAATLPAHWNLGIDSQYIATASFTTIGTDWWDTADDTKGRMLRFQGLTREDGKKFIETEIFAVLGCFSPILSSGELGLQRLTSIVSSAEVVTVLDETNISKAGKAAYAHDKIINFVRVNWGYSQKEDRFRRSNFFVDPDSRTKHGLSDIKVLQFKGLQSSIHSVDAVRTMFDAYRDRFAGPPISLQLTLLPSLNVLEVGDVVRVNLTNYPDYFDTDKLDRAFEIQQVTTDWDSGKVVVKLAGSTQRASSLVDYEGDETIPSATAVPDSKYTDEGTDMETAFAAETSRAGSVVTLNSSVTFNGTTTYSASSVLYVDGDLTIPFGVNLNITNNVFLKVKGFINCFGTINGKGLGASGEDYRRYMNPISFVSGDHSQDNYPTVWDRRIDSGYPEALTADNFLLFSASSSAASFFMRTFYSSSGSSGKGTFGPVRLAKNADTDRRKPFVVPFLDIEPTTLEGFPATLWGRGGKAGNPNYETLSGGFYNPEGQGGSGGNGGAGLIVLCRGMDFGANGKIDLSGDDGGAATYAAHDYIDYFNGPTETVNIKAGDGAPGHSGCLYILIDGANNSPPDISATTVLCNNGAAPETNSGFWPGETESNFGLSSYFIRLGFNINYRNQSLTSGQSYNRPFYNDLPYPLFAQTDGWQSHALLQFLIAPTTAVDEPEEITDQPLSIALTEYTNTPETPEGNQSTIDITVTPPSATNYSYSIIEARKSGETGWQVLGPAQNERSFQVDSDGSTWEFRALAVSTTGNVLENGPTQSIVVTNFTGNESTIRPAYTVTGLRLFGGVDNDNVFDTPDLQLTWDLNNQYGVGYTPLWFSHFEVEIRTTGNVLLATETTKTNVLFISLTDNKNFSGGPYSAFKIKVRQVTVDGTQGTFTEEDFTNNNPGQPYSVEDYPTAYGCRIRWTNTSGADLAGVEVYMDTTPSFNASSANRVFNAAGNICNVADLDPATTYYYKLRSFDVFGNFSGYTTEFTFTTENVDWGDLTNIPIDLWEGGNLIPASVHWDIGTGSAPSVFNVNGSAAENDRIISQGPFGNDEIVWRCIPDSSDDADGGWITSALTVDPDKTYIFGVYFQKVVDSDGQFYMGCGTTGTLYLDDTPNTNPYFVNGEINAVPQKWHLAIGVLHSNNYSGSDTGLAGIYDLDTGEKVYDGNEFKLDNSGIQNHRCYHYYNTSGDGSTVKQWMARPFVIDSINFPGIDSLTRKLTNVAANATRNLVFRQSVQPTGENPGDIWIDTGDSNRIHYFNGTGWQDSADLRIQTALDNAATAQSTADGKIESFFQATQPGSASEGDIWFDTDDGNRAYRYNGSTWDDAKDSGIAQAISDAATAQATADGRVTLFFSDAPPTANAVGDLWFNTVTSVLSTWRGSSWDTTGADWADLQNIPADLWEGGNLIPATQHWTVDSGGNGLTMFGLNGTSAENDRVIDDGPFGNQEVIWRCIPDANNDGDGGWNTDNFAVDPDKTYIFGVYFKKVDDGAVDGAFHLGCAGTSGTLNLDGSPNINPYFIPGERLSGWTQEWRLAIGVLHANSYSGGYSGIAGIYDLDTGERVYVGTEYKLDTSGVQKHRCYHFYNTTGDGATVKQWMARPFVVEASNFPGVDSLTKKLSGVAANATRNLVFRQDAEPTGENAGDLWVDTNDNNKLYYFNGTSWLTADDLRIQTALDNAAAAQSTADGKIDSFYQAAQPGSASLGDIWFDTDNGNKIYRYDGSAWQDAEDSGIAQAISDASNAQATADGKVTTFFQGTTPTAEGVGDLWVDTSDNNHLFRWNGTSWQSQRDATIAIAQSTADSRVSTFVQAAAPTANATGDLWFDSDDNNKLYRWNGSSWAASDDSRIAQALADAATAQSTADGKIVTYAQDSAPGSADEGDLWIETDNQNKLRRYNGSIWMDVQDEGISTALVNAAAAQSTADGKATTFFSTSTPTADATGDLWYNSNTQLFKRWDGTNWVAVSSFADNDIADSSDLIYNGAHTLISPDGTPAGILAFSALGGTVNADMVDWLDYANGQISVNDGTLTQVGACYRAFKVDPNTKYRVTFTAKASAADTIRTYFFEKNSELDDGTRHVLYGSPYTIEAAYSRTNSSSFVTLASSESLTTSWQTFTYEYTPTSGVEWASFTFRRASGTATTIVHVKAVTCVPIINSDADNTQSQVDNGNVSGLDSYASSAIFMRLHQSLFWENKSGSYSSSSLDQNGRAWLEVEDANASQWDYVERVFQVEVNTALNDWNLYADRKFRCRIDITPNTGNQNPNLMVSIATGEYYYSAGTLYCRGFGFYLDSNWDFVAFCQKNANAATAPQTVAMGVGTDDQISGYIDLEAVYDNTAKEITFTIKTSSSQTYTQTMDLSGSTPQGHRYNACTVRVQKTGTTANNAAWADGFYIGEVLFQQS